MSFFLGETTVKRVKARKPQQNHKTLSFNFYFVMSSLLQLWIDYFLFKLLSLNWHVKFCPEITEGWQKLSLVHYLQVSKLLFLGIWNELAQQIALALRALAIVCSFWKSVSPNLLSFVQRGTNHVDQFTSHILYVSYIYFTSLLYKIVFPGLNFLVWSLATKTTFCPSLPLNLKSDFLP